MVVRESSPNDEDLWPEVHFNEFCECGSVMRKHGLRRKTERNKQLVYAHCTGNSDPGCFRKGVAVCYVEATKKAEKVCGICREKALIYNSQNGMGKGGEAVFGECVSEKCKNRGMIICFSSRKGEAQQAEAVSIVRKDKKPAKKKSSMVATGAVQKKKRRKKKKGSVAQQKTRSEEKKVQKPTPYELYTRKRELEKVAMIATRARVGWVPSRMLERQAHMGVSEA